MPDIKNTQNFVNGEFVPPVDAKYFDHINPSTGLKSCGVPDSGILDLVKAIQAANKAYVNWQRTTLEERCAFVEKMADLFTERISSLAKIQARDIGTPIRYAEQISIPSTAKRFRDAVKLSSLNTLASGSNEVRSLGVVSIVTTWSNAFDTIAHRVAPALVQGNTVIVKPSEFSAMRIFVSPIL